MICNDGQKLLVVFYYVHVSVHLVWTLVIRNEGTSCGCFPVTVCDNNEIRFNWKLVLFTGKKTRRKYFLFFLRLIALSLSLSYTANFVLRRLNVTNSE